MYHTKKLLHILVSAVTSFSLQFLMVSSALSYLTVVDKVALAARRSLGSLIAKSKENGGFSVQTYSYLYTQH